MSAADRTHPSDADGAPERSGETLDTGAEPASVHDARETVARHVATAVALAGAPGAHVALAFLAGDGFPRVVPARSVGVARAGVNRIEVRLGETAGRLPAPGADGVLPFQGQWAGSPVTLSCRDGKAEGGYQLLGRVHGTSDGGMVILDVDKVVPETPGAVPAEGPRPRQQPAAPAGAPVLTIGALSIDYGTTRAVNDLSFGVDRGEIFGLLGPNGAGKTSTLSAIEGLLTPRSGSVMLDGVDVLRHPLVAKAKMGVQLQATSFQSNLTIKQIFRLFAGLYGVALSESRVVEALRSAGLEAEATKPYKQLSGGQQQRLALQIAVVHDPVLLLLDEPTAGLDPQARRQLWSRIEGLRQEGGSILLTTHSMEEAQAVCDRVAIIDHGALLTMGSPQELIDRHRDDRAVRALAHGEVTLDDVFVGLTGSDVRD